MTRLTRLWLAALLLAVPFSGFAEDEPSPEVASIPVHFENRELSQIVDAIARSTGRSFIYGDDLTNRVTVTVPSRVKPEEALELLNAILFLEGFAAIPMEGGVNKIVNANQLAASAPRVEGPLEITRDRPLATLVRLKKANAESVVTALAPLTAETGVALGYAPTNTVILAGTEGQVARLLKVSRLIDRAADEDIMVRSLRYREADVIVGFLKEVFEGKTVGGSETLIWSDPRSNQVIARAAPEQILAIEELIDDLDHPVRGGGGVDVVRVVNRDATEVAEQLELMAKGTARSSQPVAGTDQTPDAGENLLNRIYTVSVDEPTQSLILVADADTMAVLKEVIAALDKMPPRISVEVIIMEVLKPSNFAFGVDYFLPILVPSKITDPIVFVSTNANVFDALRNPFAGLDSGVPATPAPDSTFFGRYARAPLQIPLVDENGEVPISISVPRDEFAIDASDIESKATVLVRPHLVVLSGEEHELFVGDNLPIPVSSTSGSESNAFGVNPATSTVQNIERVDAGMTLRVKPIAGQEGEVFLDLNVELSGLADSLAGNVEDVGPTLTERKITAKLSLAEGEHAIIGTALDRKEADVRYGVPFLRDIPGLGYLFGGIRKTSFDLDLMIVVTAHVMRTLDDQLAESIRRRLAMERNLTRFRDPGEIETQRFAVLLDTVNSASKAKLISENFAADGFATYVDSWDAYGEKVWDIYLVDLPSFAKAGALARALDEAGWSPQITLLSKKDDPSES